MRQALTPACLIFILRCVAQRGTFESTNSYCKMSRYQATTPRSCPPTDWLFVVRTIPFRSASKSCPEAEYRVGVVPGKSPYFPRTRPLPRKHFRAQTYNARSTPGGNQKKGWHRRAALLFDFGRPRLHCRLYPPAQANNLPGTPKYFLSLSMPTLIYRRARPKISAAPPPSHSPLIN